MMTLDATTRNQRPGKAIKRNQPYVEMFVSPQERRENKKNIPPVIDQTQKRLLWRLFVESTQEKDRRCGER
jgi:hypothetical protein